MKKYYVGMDVHKATIAIAVLDASGKLVSQSIIETSTHDFGILIWPLSAA